MRSAAALTTLLVTLTLTPRAQADSISDSIDNAVAVTEGIFIAGTLVPLIGNLVYVAQGQRSPTGWVVSGAVLGGLSLVGGVIGTAIFRPQTEPELQCSETGCVEVGERSFGGGPAFAVGIGLIGTGAAALTLAIVGATTGRKVRSGDDGPFVLRF